MVWSANVETGEVELKEVTEVFVREDNILVHLTVNGSVINTTALHPFYVADKGWTEAIEIEVGDKVLLQDGTTAIIEDKIAEQFDTPVKVYNFTVDEFHTYFVGEDRVLVHNANYHGNDKRSTKPQHGYEIFNTETGDVVKTGISGQSLNQNGTSPRANRQVNKFNKESSDEIYAARVIKEFKDRISALNWEQENTNRLFEELNSMAKHIKPTYKPH